MKLISLSEFTQMADIGESKDDPQLEQLIEWVSGAMETVMDRWLIKKAYTEEIMPEGGERTLHLRAYPIASSPALIVTDYGSVVNAADYHLNLERGKLTRKTSVWSNYGYPTVSITYTGGYEEIGQKEEKVVMVKDDLKLACFLQTSYFWRNRKELGLTSLSMGGVNVALAPADWLDAVKKILQANARITI